MPEEERSPLRTEEVLAVTQKEWRPGEKLPARISECWQLVYVSGGTVEESADLRHVTLGPGWVYFHQPGEAFGMRVAGDIPPEVLRVDFTCGSAAMDLFRGIALHTDAVERICLGHLAAAARELYAQPREGESKPRLRADAPFAAHQQLQLQLEFVLITMARRLRGNPKASTRTRRDRSSAVLLETVRLYFAANLEKELTVEQVCRDNGCTRARLQKVFRARTKSGAMEYFARMKVERAKELLQTGHSPGETAQRLGYSSGAYFSRCFKRVTGQTPHAFQMESLKK